MLLCSSAEGNRNWARDDLLANSVYSEGYAYDRVNRLIGMLRGEIAVLHLRSQCGTKVCRFESSRVVRAIHVSPCQA